MPNKKKSKTALKPYRMSYYFFAEEENIPGGDGKRVPLHSAIVQAESEQEALDLLRLEIGQANKAIILKVYPFYRKLSEAKRKTWFITSGPSSEATKSVLKDLSGMSAHDEHEQLMDTFDPNEGQPVEKLPAVVETLSVVKEKSSNEEYCSFHPFNLIVNGHCSAIDTGNPYVATTPEPERGSIEVPLATLDWQDSVPLAGTSSSGTSLILREEIEPTRQKSSLMGSIADISLIFTVAAIGIKGADALLEHPSLSRISWGFCLIPLVGCLPWATSKLFPKH